MIAVLPLPRRIQPAMPGMVLALFAALAVLVPVVTQRGMVAALTLAGLAALALHLKAGRTVWPAVRDSAVLRAAALYVAWATLSTAWALTPALALQQALQFAGALLVLAALLAVASGLERQERRLVGMGAILGALLGAAALTADYLAGLPLQYLVHSSRSGSLSSFLNKGLVTLVLLSWPAAFQLWQLGRRAAAALLLGVVCAVVLPQDSSTAVLALGCGILAAVLTRLTGRTALWLMALALVTGAVAIPWVVHPLQVWFWEHMELIPWWSSHHRLYIWSFVVERVGEKPWFGWGLEAARTMPNFGWPGWRGYHQVIPLHPHNNLLQTWLDLGAVGVMVLLSAILMPLRRASALPRDQRVFVAGAWASAVAAAVPGYGAGQSWWLFTVLAQGVLMRALLVPQEE